MPKTDKEIKADFKEKASKSPDEYYATSVLRREGFERKQCKCGSWFWTVNEGQKVCGDPACSGGFRFIGDSPSKKKMDYIGVWKEFAKLFRKQGYTPIERYPVVARWRNDTDFVQASIYDFQPYVVSGEVEPPANPLVVPQFCLRFNDIDNVGITGAHYTGFVMIGQHAFMPSEKWDQAKFFSDIHTWLRKGLGLPDEEITFHEDAWAGGGNFGPCMEYFSRGLELGNQVYMLYEVKGGNYNELPLRVLDMGMGHERNAWFTGGKSTSYECVFPTVAKKLYKTAGFKADHELVKRFLPYSSYLNVDEVEDIDKVWKDVASKAGADVKTLKGQIVPLSAIYSIGEHSRSLLFALNDGALPSNTGGGYNLRVILRRALSFIDQYGWDVDLGELAEEHAKYLKPLFPELMGNLNEVKEILEVERKKYLATKEKSKRVISGIIEKGVDEKELLNLYDSQGITPEMVRNEARLAGKKMEIPDDFYARVAELHLRREEACKVEVEEVDVKGVPETEALYFEDYNKLEFEGKVLKAKDNFVILDRTAFYPTSGGQDHDTGMLNNEEVVDVFKQGAVIVHKLKEKTRLKEGEKVKGSVDRERRHRLAHHHTATHIVNAAAREVIGNHVNQAGARKTEEKASLDITHYAPLTGEQVKKIEKLANEIVEKKIKLKSSFLARAEAEKRYGMRIYQGGAVPGKKLRIVEIPNIDIECCAGTHLDSTDEAGEIKIVKSTKISDAIVRIEFKAGKAAKEEMEQGAGLLGEATKAAGVSAQELPSYCSRLFAKWKKAKKASKKGKKIGLDEPEIKGLESESLGKEELLRKAAAVFSVQPEHLPKAIGRFKKELDSLKEQLK